MATRAYPIWKPNAPQLRIFLPNFTMVLLKPKDYSPPNLATFRVDMKMTSMDVRNYLKHIYKVPARDVRTEVLRPEEEVHPGGGHKFRRPDYKLAYVLLDKEYKFEFPDIFPEAKEKELQKENAEFDDLLDKMRQRKMENWDRAGAPTWFSL